MAGGEVIILAAFGVQVPVEFGACGNCYRKAATGKSHTNSEDLEKW